MPEEIKDIKKISDADLSNLLDFDGGAPSEIPKQPTSIFSKPLSDNAEIFNSSAESSSEKNEDEKKVVEKTTEELDALLSVPEEKEEITKDNKPKDNELDTLLDLVKSGDILLFEAEEGKAEKSLSEYTKKERVELLKANHQRIREEEQKTAAEDLFDALPEKMQYALKYAMEGGTNLEAMFTTLAQSIQTESLDVATEAGQEQIVRKWGAETGLTAEEIEEEVISLKDMPGALEKKANVYKPKLDAKQQQIVERQVRDAEVNKKKGEAVAAKYRETIYNAVTGTDLDGLKLTPSIQGMLYNGLSNFDKRASNNRVTNGLGMLLDKYNFTEPNPTMVAKVYWLLEDPKGFEAAILARGNTETVTEIARKLKGAESQKSTATNLELTQNNTNIRKTIKKPTANVFAR